MAESRQDKDFHPDRHRNELSIFRISVFYIMTYLYLINLFFMGCVGIKGMFTVFLMFYM